jgi:hypothetical protein
MKLVPILHRILVKPKQLAEANETYRKMSELGLVIPDVTDVKREQQAVEIGITNPSSDILRYVSFASANCFGFTRILCNIGTSFMKVPQNQ